MANDYPRPILSDRKAGALAALHEHGPSPAWGLAAKAKTALQGTQAWNLGGVLSDLRRHGLVTIVDKRGNAPIYAVTNFGVRWLEEEGKVQ